MSTVAVRDYVRGIWDCRYFCFSLVHKDVVNRYRRSLLGMGWSLLQPIAMTAVLCTVFHQVFAVSVEHFAPFLLSGISFWNFFSGSALLGCQCIHQGETYIRQHPAPLAIYPLRTVLAMGFHFLLALMLVVILSWCMNGFGNLATLWCLVPALLMFFVFGWSVTILTGIANVYFPDSQHLAEVGLQILFYATPVIYPPETLSRAGLQAVFTLNPIGAYLRLIREPVIDARIPDVATFGLAAGGTAVMALLAILVLVKCERRLVLHL
jgi:ABC-type polysaccharide/polyol phosphate export permease